MNDANANQWQQMLRDSSVRSKIPSVNFIIVGDPGTGKESLLARMSASNRANLSNSENWNPTKQNELLSSYSDNQASNPLQKSDALFKFAAIPISDKHVAVEADESIAMINAWSLNDLDLHELLQIALQSSTLEFSVAAVTVDLSSPWSMQKSIEKWTSALEGAILQQMSQIDPQKRSSLYQSIKNHLLDYGEPGMGGQPSDTRGPMDSSSRNEFLEEGILDKNLGIPFVIIVTKSDLRPESSLQVDYLEYSIRMFAIRYGAAVFYTSAKTESNIALLQKYILHRACPAQFSYNEAPQLIERGAIFLPSGYDSVSLINQSLVGSQPRWQPDTPFEKIIPDPSSSTFGLEKEDHSKSTSNISDVQVEQHEAWLERLEKAAGAGLEDLQKQSVEASKKAEAASLARRTAAERRKREDKDVSSKHLANFFNNLLSRPEKSKTARSTGGDLKKN
uniref:Dynein light intermediate chain n=1 Tax=Albugo laibachii Nc14 TaxID=890382 RepID=F0VZ01_9STRA|nr:dynein 1 light intermediate chain putative [Albugo laibachii Nc14]|eukprot:CCA14016.1 dynein 1 light intermediate chain putative [Albugo laibachii Nc14]